MDRKLVADCEELVATFDFKSLAKLSNRVREHVAELRDEVAMERARFLKASTKYAAMHARMLTSVDKCEKLREKHDEVVEAMRAKPVVSKDTIGVAKLEEEEEKSRQVNERFGVTSKALVDFQSPRLRKHFWQAPPSGESEWTEKRARFEESNEALKKQVALGRSVAKVGDAHHAHFVAKLKSILDQLAAKRYDLKAEKDPEMAWKRKAGRTTRDRSVAEMSSVRRGQDQGAVAEKKSPGRAVQDQGMADKRKAEKSVQDQRTTAHRRSRRRAAQDQMMAEKRGFERAAHGQMMADMGNYQKTTRDEEAAQKRSPGRTVQDYKMPEKRSFDKAVRDQRVAEKKIPGRAVQGQETERRSPGRAVQGQETERRSPGRAAQGQAAEKGSPGRAASSGWGHHRPAGNGVGDARCTKSPHQKMRPQPSPGRG